MDIQLFSLHASEVCIYNPNAKLGNSPKTESKVSWIDTFLPAWNGSLVGQDNYRVQNRESIIVEFIERDFYDIIVDQDFRSNEYVRGKFHLEKKSYEILGIYSSTLPRKIVYFEGYYTAREEIKQIIRIHERMHAYQHVNKGSTWNGFIDVSPVYTEFLAQLFTFKCVQGTYLENYFRNLSAIQPSIYQTWLHAEMFTDIEVHAIYNEIMDNGFSKRFGLDVYADAYEEFLNVEESKKISKVKSVVKENYFEVLESERALIYDLIQLKKKNNSFNDTKNTDLHDVVVINAIRNIW